jgi:hypothetical protein
VEPISNRETDAEDGESIAPPAQQVRGRRRRRCFARPDPPPTAGRLATKTAAFALRPGSRKIPMSQIAQVIGFVALRPPLFRQRDGAEFRWSRAESKGPALLFSIPSQSGVSAAQSDRYGSAVWKSRCAGSASTPILRKRRKPSVNPFRSVGAMGSLRNRK